LTRGGELKAGGVYSLIGIAQTSIWVLLIPIHTKFLSPEDYGLIAICTAAVVGLATVLEFGLSRAAAHTRFTNRESASTYQDELATPIRFLLLVAVGFLGIALVLEWLGFFAWLHLPFPFGILTVGAAVGLPITRVYGEVLKMESEFSEYAKLMVLILMVNLCSNIALVAIFQIGPVGVLLSIVLANWIGVFFVIIAMKGHFFTRFDLAGLKSSLSYGLPLVPHFSIGAFLPLVERSLLTYFVGAQVTGIYAVATSLANMMTIITTSVTTALRPRVFKLLESKKPRELGTLSNIMLLTVCGFICLAFIGGVLAEPVISILADKEFYSAWMLVPLLLMRQAIYGAFQFIASVFYYVREGTRKLVWVSGGAILVLIFGSAILVPKYGVYGMVTMSVFVASSYLFYATVLVKKLHIMHWPIFKVSALLMFGCMLSFGAYLPFGVKIFEITAASITLFVIFKALSSLLRKGEQG